MNYPQNENWQKENKDTKKFWDTHELASSVGNKSYCYDYNGNMVSDSSGAQQSRQMQYSTFDKLTQVTKGGHTTRFSYAPSKKIKGDRSIL
ncbi:hypothetical protein [Kangiella sp. TOML190]|uniref:hypothetical protein n=1 Tax=Kangiella sp. TOML190 TaxID=2931351 RepID=UPI00203A4A4F|nr:hypothetical protein [Kangiella sp. TOML190]